MQIPRRVLFFASTLALAIAAEIIQLYFNDRSTKIQRSLKSCIEPRRRQSLEQDLWPGFRPNRFLSLISSN
jgi:hypothetical protein